MNDDKKPTPRPATDEEVAIIKAYVELDDKATQEMRQAAWPLYVKIDDGEVIMPPPYDDAKAITRNRMRNKHQRAVAEGDDDYAGHTWWRSNRRF